MHRALMIFPRFVSLSAKLACWRLSLIVLSFLVSTGCGTETLNEDDGADRYEPISYDPTLIAPEFARSFLSEDGKAEIAFYSIEIENEDRRLFAESVLSKHYYNPVAHVETTPDDPAMIPSLKWRFFYELFEGPKSYHIKGSRFVYLDWRDFRLLKQSAGWTSWEAGACCDPTFLLPDGSYQIGYDRVKRKASKEKHGDFIVYSPATFYEAKANAYFFSQIPLLVRALDFSQKREHVFLAALRDGRFVNAHAILAGMDTIETPGSTVEAEKIIVEYDLPPDGDYWTDRLISATRGSQETYWRSTRPNRQLLRMDTMYYERKLSLRLIEEIRADYRNEDFYPQLEYFKNRIRPAADLDPHRSSPLPSKTVPLGHTEAKPVQVEARGTPITDLRYLTNKLWNDGKSEISFYKVHSRWTGNAEVVAGTILAKHDINPAALLKTRESDPERVSAFLWILLYEFDANTANRYRHFFLHEVRQADLRLYSYSASRISWEGQCSYGIRVGQNNLMKGTGSRCTDFSRLPPTPPVSYQSSIFAPGQIPLLIRSLDFSEKNTHTFQIYVQGRLITAQAERLGFDTVVVSDEEREAEKIIVRYADSVEPNQNSAPVGLLGGIDREEVYWRSTKPNRQLLKLKAENYGMVLIEEVRAKHWQEDFFPRLRHVTRYP